MAHQINVLEVCVASVQDAIEAVAGGADRLELNAALELGGLTPTAGQLTEVKQVAAVPIIVMVRPRGAGFCYSPAELRVMLRDAESLLESGADGIAVGVLTEGGRPAEDVCRQLVRLAGARQIVFHRAFDAVKDPRQALGQLSELGFTRVMTSGQAPSAWEGAGRIATWQEEFGAVLELLPAAGVNPDNAAQLLRRTGCHQLHGSFRKFLSDHAGCVADRQYGVTDQQLVAATRQAIDAATMAPR